MTHIITNSRIDRLLRQGQVEEALNEPLQDYDARTQGVARFVSRPSLIAEDTVLAGMTLGKFLYEYIRIDPDVVRAVSFARASDIDSVISFARFAETKADFTGPSLDGLHSELQGYVAEQLVAHHLVAQGHDVNFPNTPNNAGWDLMVDGHPFQIKCVADSDAVLEHLHRYPDIPVIVNSEIASQMADHAGVYVDPELHHDAVRDLTEDALARGQEMTNFEIPWLSIGLSGAANLYYMLKNDTDITAMLTCTASDALGRTAGGLAGKYAGAGTGALLFGPAGVIVVGMLGAIGGSMIGRRVVAKGRTLLVADEEIAVRASAHRVAEAAIDAMPQKLEAWREKRELLMDCLAGTNGNRIKLQKAMNCRMTEHIEYWATKKSELQEFAKSSEGSPVHIVERVLLLLRRAGIHSHHVQQPLRELSSKLQNFTEACKRFRLSPV